VYTMASASMIGTEYQMIFLSICMHVGVGVGVSTVDMTRWRM
jgi:hypothetical protein